jgi:hypothetical protein
MFLRCFNAVNIQYIYLSTIPTKAIEIAQICGFRIEEKQEKIRKHGMYEKYGKDLIQLIIIVFEILWRLCRNIYSVCHEKVKSSKNVKLLCTILMK